MHDSLIIVLYREGIRILPSNGESFKLMWFGVSLWAWDKISSCEASSSPTTLKQKKEQKRKERMKRKRVKIN